MKNIENEPDWQELMQLFCDVENKNIMSQMFHLFLTMGEREALLGRYRIIHAMMTTHMPQREIAEKLEQSITKITMGSKALQIITDELKEYLTKEMKKETKVDGKRPRKTDS